MAEVPTERAFVVLGEQEALPAALIETLAALLLAAPTAATEQPRVAAPRILLLEQSPGRSASRQRRTRGKAS